MRTLGLVGSPLLMSLCAASVQERLCGTSRGDWCPAPPGDACGVHQNSADCQADGRCRAMRYRGPPYPDIRIMPGRCARLFAKLRVAGGRLHQRSEASAQVNGR